MEIRDLTSKIIDKYSMRPPSPYDAETLEDQAVVVMSVSAIAASVVAQQVMESLIGDILHADNEVTSDNKVEARKQFHEAYMNTTTCRMILDRVRIGHERYGNDIRHKDNKSLLKDAQEELADMLVYVSWMLAKMYHDDEDGDSSYFERLFDEMHDMPQDDLSE